MKLLGAVSEGSGLQNEDAAGFVGPEGDVFAAWVFDGVTGINARNYFGSTSDAAWFVSRAEKHLRVLVMNDTPLLQILEQLVDHLIADWNAARADIQLPDGFDVPASCLLLVKRYKEGWKALRLGDSFLLSAEPEVKLWDGPPTDLGELETELRRQAQQQRLNGTTDFKVLLQQFHPQLMASRRARNTKGNHSILVADRSALAQPEVIDLGWPEAILLCTDGFYRAVDTYHMLSDAELVAACDSEGGVASVLESIRKTEAEDLQCEKHMRFKPADDVSAIMLSAVGVPR